MPSSLYGSRHATSGAPDLRIGGGRDERRPRRSGSTLTAAVTMKPSPPGNQRRLITPAEKLPTCSGSPPFAGATWTCVEPLREALRQVGYARLCGVSRADAVRRRRHQTRRRPPMKSCKFLATVLLVALPWTTRAQVPERTIDEIKTESLARAQRGAYPLGGLDPKDVADALALVMTRDRDD